MQKAYDRIDWENEPSQNTPLNEQNLNRMSAAIDEVDNRVINLNTTKATKGEISELFSGVDFNESTGVITFTRKNGSQITIDTKLEKLAINFSYDPVKEQLVITLDDGTKQYVDLSALVTVYEFLDSDTIAFAVEGGKVKAIVKEGSIQGKHLQPNYLADITVQTEIAANKAGVSSDNAVTSESFAHGGTGKRQNEDVDNAKYYYEQAKMISQGLSGAILPMGTISFEELQSVAKQAGYMFNISNEFVTDDTFKEGAGNVYPAGTNVYYTADGYWDCYAGAIESITIQEIESILAEEVST